MNKNLIIINGTMGVGKTTVCRSLLNKLNSSVWLDGDWCWMMNPWNISEENKRMVEANIVYLLRNYLSNSSYEYVIFSWVLHKEKIIKSLLGKLNEFSFNTNIISLLCSESELIRRMKKDNRSEKNIRNSIDRLILYKKMKTIKIDTTGKHIYKTVDEIINIVKINSVGEAS